MTETSVQSMRELRPALHHGARVRIRALIIRGHLAPGTGIGEAALSEALGMSRTPIREALKLLALEGLIELRPNRGAYVSTINVAEIANLFEVCCSLEGLAAELAALRATKEDIARLQDLQKKIDQLHSTGDLDGYFEMNQAIHHAIVLASKNPVLRESHELVFARVERVRYLALAAHGRWDESVTEHHQILSALERRESKLAAELQASHVRRTGQLAVELLTSSRKNPSQEELQSQVEGQADQLALEADCH
jgi:DNA-binding GntR family transcriptional regulator